MLSQVTSIQGLLILQPFVRNKISCNISQDLREENKRLRVLSLQTLAKESKDTIEVEEALNELACTNLTYSGHTPASAPQKQKLQPNEADDQPTKQKHT